MILCASILSNKSLLEEATKCLFHTFESLCHDMKKLL